MYSVAALQKVFNAVQNPQISTYARVIWSRDEVHLGLDGGVHQPYDAKKRINYKWAVLTFKTQQTSSPQYLNQHISLRTSARNARSSSIPLLCVPFRRTSFARQSFSTAAPLTWNSLPHAVLNCDSLLWNPHLEHICFLLLSANYTTYLFRQRLCSRLTA